MKPRMALLLLLLTVSCRPDRYAVDVDDPGPESWPANSEVLAFIEGKSLSLYPVANSSLVIHQDLIEALSVEPRGVSTAEGAWATRISLILNTRRARYTVEAVVDHHLVCGERIFTAFTVKRIARR